MKKYKIGDIVKIIIDRPLGTYHPEHEDMYYPINYGYVEGIFAADGEEQDAYLLGINEPVSEYIGRIIAIIHRYDDVEEKWVVVPENTNFTREEIAKQVYFQEQYFKSEIRMGDQSNSPTEHINRHSSHSLDCDLDNAKIDWVIWMSFLDSVDCGLDFGVF